MEERGMGKKKKIDGFFSGVFFCLFFCDWGERASRVEKKNSLFFSLPFPSCCFEEGEPSPPE